MTFSFKNHQEGCTPFSPCNNCDVASVLRSNLTDEQFVEFTKTVATTNFSFTEHVAGCSPATPCNNCAMMAWLRATLSVPKYGDLVFILTGERPVDPEMHRRLLSRVDSLGLSERAANCLRNDKIVTVGQLVRMTEHELLRIPNFGRRSLNEIEEVLATLGLRLGMKVET